jgi:ATP-binding cassette subfamily B protein
MTAAIVGGQVRIGAPLRELVRPWRGRIVLLAAGVISAAVLDLLPPLIMGTVVDGLTTGSTAGLSTAAAWYLAAVAGVQILTASYGYLAASIAQRALATLRTRLFAHLLALPIGYHDRTPVGDGIARATADVETIDDLFSSSIVTLLGETARLVTVAVAMVLLSPVLTVGALIVVPPLAILTAFLRRRIRTAERDTRVAVGETTTQLQEDLAGVDVIRAFGRESQFSHRFRVVLGQWLAASNTSTRYNAFYAPALAVLSAIATAVLVWLGGGGAARAAGVSIGTLTAFILLFARFFTPLINLGDEWQNVQAALAGAERVFAVLAQPVEPHATTAPDLADATPSPILVRALGFAYHGGRPVLDDINLIVSPGEHVALVGRTGAGKTTLLALLTGLYRPKTGIVRLDGHDPTTLTDGQRGRLLGVVPQTVQLFTGTVRDNLTLDDASPTDEQIDRACRIAGIDTVIASLPEHYDTVLAGTGRGGGIVLSAGQRQLLALARALVQQPRVLLLDEATAVVDGASDARFRAALREHVQPTGTAILTVAHRLSTARDADRIVVLAGGRVLEQGAPHELLTTDSAFAALLAMEEAGWDWEQEFPG